MCLSTVIMIQYLMLKLSVENTITEITPFINVKYDNNSCDMKHYYLHNTLV